MPQLALPAHRGQHHGTAAALPILTPRHTCPCTDPLASAPGTTGQTPVASSATAQADGSVESSSNTTSASNSTSTNTTQDVVPEKTASFDLDNSTRAQLDLPTVAYDAANGTVNYTIGVDMKTDGGKTRLALRFPYHTTMFYDPVTSFVDVADAETAGGTYVAISSQAPGGSTSGTGTTSTTGGNTSAKNGAAAGAAAGSLLLGGLGAAALLLLGL